MPDRDGAPSPDRPAQLVLHVGAHRTGTTALQQYMRQHEQALGAAGYRVAYPPKSRREAPPALGETPWVVSEENYLGSMGGCVRACALYPTAEKHLTALPEALRAADVVYLSIRDLATWWTSAIAFGVKMGQALPGPSVIDRIVEGTRSWVDVVEAVRTAFPHARIVVRDFTWQTDNPAAQLSRLTHWPVWERLPGDTHAHNRRPDLEAMAAALLERGDLASLSRLPEDGIFSPFDPPQVAELADRYEGDLRRLANDRDIEFWGADTPVARSGPAGISGP